MASSIFESKEYLSVTYSEKKAPYGEYPFLFGKFLLNKFFSKNGKILDLGCGRAEYVKVFQDIGLESYGVDISPRVLEYGDGYNVKMANLNAGECPYEDDSFDFIFSKSVIEHMTNPMGLLQSSYQKLKQGGTAVIMTPSWAHNYKEAFYIDHTHVTPFTKSSLIDAMKMAGYKEVEVIYFYQLPLLWKYPFLSVFSRIMSLIPLPYAPLHEVPWGVSNKLNKYIRFSKEVMLLAVAKK